jgi:spoIIIJ-associated protein
MEWVETTGKTVEEALDVALDQLGVLEDDVEYEILVEPKPGLFGRFGGSEARLRARVKPMSREKPGDRRRGRKPRRNGSSESGSSRPGRGKGPSGGTGGSGRPEGSGGRDGGSLAGGEGSKPRRRRGGRGRSGAGNGSAGNGGASTRPTDEGATMSDQPEIGTEEQTEAAEAFTKGLVEAFGLEATVAGRVDDEILLVEVDGENLGILVGPKGATLHAIEELVRTVVQRRTGGHGMRIHVDVAGYRAKRREALAAFTEQLVEKVLESGREQMLDPMPPPDRKVVHDTVAEIDGVATASEGEEPRRRVVIRRA